MFMTLGTITTGTDDGVIEDLQSLRRMAEYLQEELTPLDAKAASSAALTASFISDEIIRRLDVAAGRRAALR